MKIFTLTGPSGTGKSFRAMDIAKQNNIEAIIDDGLLIYKNVVVAGESAKKSQTKIGAIRDAVFEKEEKAAAIREAIAKKKPESILILGTSDKMVDMIVKRVILNENSEKVESDVMAARTKHWPAEKFAAEHGITRIHIEDITTEDERQAARTERVDHGKHVIPAPSMQLKRSFAGYFRDPLRVIRGKDQGAAQERTVVRPMYSYMGDYIITDKAISDIVKCVERETDGVVKVIYIGQSKGPENYEISLAISIKKGYPIMETAAKLQKDVHLTIEEMTAFNVSFVNVEVRGIV